MPIEKRNALTADYLSAALVTPTGAPEPLTLAEAIAARSPSDHSHNFQPASAVLSALAELNETPVGTSSDQVAAGNHGHAGFVALHKTWRVGAEQTIAAGSEETIDFDTAVFSASGAPAHTIADGVVTPAAAGDYRCKATLAITGDTSNAKGILTLRWQVNESGDWANTGEPVVMSTQGSATQSATAAAGIITLEAAVSAGKAVRLRGAAAASWSPIKIQTGSKLTIEKLG